ncbi:ABC transporter substrate-binding protein [Ammoniphilus sp. YIM 78166]|uniref:ABC transporter substrate-binding protein n=1 Tax=Ammoniphilus sp. YIM 78166 TaxID=1644106 RepID=UPI00106F4E43|nr:ABC transporter substrate-binding protein [Ammoniphilus sp. YIM 78166]
MKKKWMFSALSMLLAASLGLAGCGSGSQTQEASKPQESAQPGAEPAKPAQDTLIVGRGGDSAALDPAIVTDGESIKITQQVFDTLLDYKPGTTDVEPSLAESHEMSADGLTYTFKLRQGVKFHDGTDFNAEAVVYNFNRWLAGDKSQFYYFVSAFGTPEDRVIKEVKALDGYTVQFTLNKTQAPFLRNLAMPAFSIASPKALEEKGDNFQKEPVGTGAFIFKEWKPNDSITLEKNPNYWKQGYPKVGKVIVRSIPENSARFTALQAGELDLIEGVNPDDLAALEANKDLQKFVRPAFNVGYLGFNTKKPPFDNPKVRQALSHAVNKEALIKAFYAGLAEPAKNPMPPSLFGYNDAIQDYPYDLEKAKALLAEAGYPNGIQEELVFYAMPVARPYMPDGKKVAEALQAEFNKIGVKTKIESPEWAVYLDDAKKGEKDHIFMLGWTGDNGDADNFLYTLLAKQTIGSNNYSQWAHDEYSDLVAKAQGELDEAKRVELYKKAQEIFKQEAPWVPLVHSTPLLAGGANVKGYIPSPTGSESYEAVYFE